MMKFGMVAVLAAALFLTGSFISQGLFAQDFPYSVPQAPEFDHRGNYMEPGSNQAADADQRSRPYPRFNDNELRYGDVKPSGPQDAPPIAPRSRAPRAQGYNPSPPGPPTMASTPPPQPQVQARPPDCSHYPMMIARAQSEPDMQMAARQYLSCLLKSGWTMDQARQHVIQTIETTYRLAR
jgi:hypothetical protein